MPLDEQKLVPPVHGYSFSIERGDEIASLLIAMAENIESHLIEKRVFKPTRKFAKHSRIGSLEKYRRIYRESIARPEKFWARAARGLVGQKRWSKVVKRKAPLAKWIAAGKC